MQGNKVKLFSREFTPAGSQLIYEFPHLRIIVVFKRCLEGADVRMPRDEFAARYWLCLWGWNQNIYWLVCINLVISYNMDRCYTDFEAASSIWSHHSDRKSIMCTEHYCTYYIHILHILYASLHTLLHVLIT